METLEILELACLIIISEREHLEEQIKDSDTAIANIGQYIESADEENRSILEEAIEARKEIRGQLKEGRNMLAESEAYLIDYLLRYY